METDHWTFRSSIIVDASIFVTELHPFGHLRRKRNGNSAIHLEIFQVIPRHQHTFLLYLHSSCYVHCAIVYQDPRNGSLANSILWLGHLVLQRSWATKRLVLFTHQNKIKMVPTRTICYFHSRIHESGSIIYDWSDCRISLYIWLYEMCWKYLIVNKCVGKTVAFRKIQR